MVINTERREERKHAIFIVVLVFAYLALIFAFFLPSIKGRGETAQARTVTGGTIGTVKIPADLSATGKARTITVKMVSDWPAELAANWKKPELAEYGQIAVKGKLMNEASQRIQFNEITYMLDGRQVGFEFGRILSPGESMPIGRGFPAYEAKTLTIQVKGFRKIGN